MPAGTFGENDIIVVGDTFAHSMGYSLVIGEKARIIERTYNNNFYVKVMTGRYIHCGATIHLDDALPSPSTNEAYSFLLKEEGY